MPRALTVNRATVPLAQRDAYIEKLRRSLSHYQAANCRFWVFEEAGLHGAFLEFTEADDETALQVAHANSPNRPRDMARVYHQVELD